MKRIPTFLQTGLKRDRKKLLSLDKASRTYRRYKNLYRSLTGLARRRSVKAFG